MIRNLIYCVLISLVLLTPFMHSDELYNGTISAKQIWFYGVMGLLILGFALDNMFTRKGNSFRLNRVDISLLVFYSYFFIRTYYTPYTPILYNQKFLNYSLLILFYFIVKYACSRVTISRDNLFSGGNYPVIVTITLVLMLTGLVEAIWGLLQLYGFTRSFHSGFKITGTFFNPAPYALYLAAIFSIALSLLMRELKNEGIKELRNERTNKNEGIKELRNERIKGIRIRWVAQLIGLWLTIYRELENKYAENPNSFILSFLHSFIRFIAWLTVISIMLVLPATMNRASWVGVGVSSFFIFNQKYHLIGHLRGWLKTGTRKILFITGLVILFATIVIGLYQFKKESSIGRRLIWEVTAGKIAEKPLFGHGVGRFEAEYNNWQAEYFQNHPEETDGPKGMATGNTKYSFNEYLEMASEIGVIGMVLFLMIFVSLFHSFKIAISRIGDEFPRIQIPRITSAKLIMDKFSRKRFNVFNSFISSNSLISLFVCALISYPFYSLSTLILLFLLVAMISSGLPVIQKFKLLQYKAEYGIRFASMFLLAPVLFFLFNLTREQYRSGFAMDEGVKLFQIQSYKEACQSFEEVYPSLKYNGPHLQYYGKALSINGDFDKSVEILERARNFTSDEVLYTTLGDAYKTLGRYPEAETAYLHASAIVPHKLYPLYLMAKLFDETGQNEKACKVSNRVLDKKIKVESQATAEIREEVRKIINKSENIEIRE